MRVFVSVCCMVLFARPAAWAQFTDTPLSPGSSVIRAVHFTELRDRTNALELICGQAPTSFTGSTPTPGTPIEAVHLTELRAAIRGAYAACALTEPTYTDPDIVPGVTGVRAVHVTELRDLLTLTTSRVVLSSDDWVFSDAGFNSLPTDTSTFAVNLATLLTGGASRRIHAFSEFFAFTGSKLAEALGDAGFTYTVGTDISFDLVTLLDFDALLLGLGGSSGSSGLPLLSTAELDVLLQYVNAGRGVYIHAGNGISEPNRVPSTWNPFLQRYGFQLGTGFDGLNGDVSIVSVHPLFDGVSALHVRGGHPITGCCVVASSPTGENLFALSAVLLSSP